jgi:hypothetical protein
LLSFLGWNIGDLSTHVLIGASPDLFIVASLTKIVIVRGSVYFRVAYELNNRGLLQAFVSPDLSRSVAMIL